MVLAGLDFETYAERTGKGLVVVERFTGRGLMAGGLDRIRATGVGYPRRR
ncbi:hypothetical protein [Dactylosporangium sp. NPDC051541]